MSKAVSRGQALEVSARVITQVNWEQLDGDHLQREVISLTSEEFGRRFTAFLQSGCRMVAGDLKFATAPFDPAVFIGQGWAFWKGPKGGNGLEGEEERDKASVSFTEVDFDKADLLTCLEKGESSITGEEKLIRLKKLGCVLYGVTVFMGLWQNYQSCQNKAESVLEKLYKQKGITYVDFLGDILRHPGGDRCVLYLCRAGDGQWRWGHDWLDIGWRARSVSAVSQQVLK
jgi:hypothetical protein